MSDPANELVIRFKMDLETATGEFISGLSGTLQIDEERTREAMERTGISIEKQLAYSQHLMEEAWMHFARVDLDDEEEEELSDGADVASQAT